ncbi:serine protease [Streptomyces sp. GMY02]|uniref:S1 family peptidase n=1 Tax=Streptomyces sp. GMY02 TaxID=1333528 RepID=UPI001C2BE79D|nr:serine protease [Streptomyces sp. GMY02]QXE38068.1 serine protease [Streptomyces sp. GMY02]
MAGGTAQRTVEVVNRERKSYGTGCLLGPGLVLTAHHVAQPGGDSVVQVWSAAGARFVKASMVWENRELDAVLLAADRVLVGSDVGIVRFGELVCDDPDLRPMCSMTGFPKAMRRRAHANPDRYVDDLKTVDGRIAPHTGSRTKWYAFEVDGAVPTEVKNWQGLSGAGVFCDGTLVGIATLVDRQWDRVLLVRPVSHLLRDEGFVRAMTDRTGVVPRLQPADLRGLLTSAPEPTLSSSYLLDPRSRVVGMTGMTGHIDQIEQWCRGTGRMDVAAVTGLGGTGKSRLVTELLDRLSNNRDGLRPWSGGFLAETPRHTEHTLFASSAYPLLIAVDLAEARISQIRDMTAALAGSHGGAAVRILLLARGDTWWPELRRYLRSQQVGPVSERFVITPDGALSGHSSEDIYVEAEADFARRIRLLRQTGRGHNLDTWQEAVVADAPRRYGAGIEHAPPQPVIYHHIAALADVLARANPDFALRDHPMEVLLANEENYLRRIAEARMNTGAVDTKLIRTLVTAQFLTGAQTVQQGRATVQAGFDVHHRGYGPTAPPDAAQLAALDDILAAAYPATDGARWGSIGEPLAVALLTEVEADSNQGFIEHLLQHEALETDQCGQALSTIVRAAPKQPGLADSAHRAVAAAPQRLLPLAIRTAAAELSAEAARQWLAGLKHTVDDHAARPGADPDTYEWAANLVARVQTHADSGGDSLEELTDILSTAQRSKRASSADANAVRPPTSGSRSSTNSRPTLVKPRVHALTRALATVVALCHLLLVAGITSYAALTASVETDGWMLWFYLPFNVFIQLAAAGLIGSRIGDAFLNWVAPPFAVGTTTLFARLAELPLLSPWPSWTPWVLWPPVFAIGLYALTFTWRIRFGHFQHP